MTKTLKELKNMSLMEFSDYLKECQKDKKYMKALKKYNRELQK